MRTKEEQIKYFEWLAEEYATDAAREEDMVDIEMVTDEIHLSKGFRVNQCCNFLSIGVLAFTRFILNIKELNI